MSESLCCSYIVCCLLMKSNAIINCVLRPISGPGDAAWKRPMWRTLLSPIVEAVSPERRAGGAGCYITPLRRLRKPEELAAIHTTDSLPADTRSISHFTFVNRDHDDPQHHCASRPLPGAVPACRGPAAPPDPAVRLPDPLQLSGGGPAADKPPRRLLKSDCPVSE